MACLAAKPCTARQQGQCCDATQVCWCFDKAVRPTLQGREVCKGEGKRQVVAQRLIEPTNVASQRRLATIATDLLPATICSSMW
jgi:hypothetical protein